MTTVSTNTAQSNGSSSSLQSNKRGPTRGEIIKKVRKQMGGARLTIDFCEEFRQAVGKNSEKFNNECGIICRNELVLMKDEMAELRQMVRTFISGQPLPSFSSSLHVQDNGSETRDR